MVSILERITGEQNGIFLDGEGLEYDAARSSRANLLLSGQRERIGAGGGGVTSTLETLLTRLNTLGAEERVNTHTRQQQQLGATSGQKEKHADQIKNIRESSQFTA